MDKVGKNDKIQDKVDIERLLQDGKSIQIKPQGYSMYPLFIPGRDQAVIAPTKAEQLKRGDVALYRRDGGILVLHRIVKRDKSGFYMVGDNQKEVEGPLREDQIRGKLVAIVRKGKMIPVENPVYRLLFGGWLFLRPFRPGIAKVAAFVKRRILGKEGPLT